MMKGTKFDTAKPPIGLISRYALEQEALVMEHGAHLYGRHNWRQGLDVQRLLNAALRHILAANEGEDYDPDSGLLHLAHARCSIAFAMETIRNFPELDDRYIPPEAPQDADFTI